MDVIDFLDVVENDEIEIDNLIRINRRFVIRANPFEVYNDREFYSRYRFSKANARRLIDILSDDLERPTQRHNALQPTDQVKKVFKFTCEFQTLRKKSKNDI